MSQANSPLILPVTPAASDLMPATPAPPTHVAEADGELLDEELIYQSLPLRLSEPMAAKVEYIGRMPPMPYPLEDDEDE